TSRAARRAGSWIGARSCPSPWAGTRSSRRTSLTLVTGPLDESAAPRGVDLRAPGGARGPGSGAPRPGGVAPPAAEAGEGARDRGGEGCSRDGPGRALALADANRGCARGDGGSARDGASGSAHHAPLRGTPGARRAQRRGGGRGAGPRRVARAGG